MKNRTQGHISPVPYIAHYIFNRKQKIQMLSEWANETNEFEHNESVLNSFNRLGFGWFEAGRLDMVLLLRHLRLPLFQTMHDYSSLFC